ncbi:MAG: aromatic ring-hydroxylating oxygenase subunit alpha [Acidimicrobiales bacterium]
MNHDLEVSILGELLDQLRTQRNADAGRQVQNPAASYTSPELAHREWTEFFDNHPQLVALTGDLPGHGTHLTVDDLGVPMLLTRADDGVVRAFVNSCRHRGTRVAEGPRGTSRTFVCPFHHWTYANDGALVGLPRSDDFGPFDRTCRGLLELPAAEQHGLIWVHPRADGELDVDALLQGLGPELDEWGLGQLAFAGESLMERDLNWKLAVDTFGETYHVDRLHRDTIAALVHSDTLTHQPFGRNHRMAFALRGIESLRDRPESEWTIDGHANVIYFLFPNIELNVNPAAVSLIKIYPDPHDPGRSRTRVSHYGGALDVVTEVFDTTIEQEDYATAETAQRAAESGAVDHFVFGRNEPALHHVHDAYRAALGMEPLESFDG